jgi:hypothetical protein
MIQKISRERWLPKQGGFEARPYKPLPICALSGAFDALATSDGSGAP